MFLSTKVLAIEAAAKCYLVLEHGSICYQINELVVRLLKGGNKLYNGNNTCIYFSEDPDIFSSDTDECHDTAIEQC
jgi:hypothetical protein